MPTYVLTTENPETGPAEWQVGGGGGLGPELTTSLEANWPRTPDELHLWAPGWSISTTLTSSDTEYAIDTPGIVVPNMEGCWVFAIGNTGGGSQAYGLAFNTASTLFGDGAFTPTAVRVSCFSTLTALDATPVEISGTLRMYATDINGDRVLAATFASIASTVIPLTGGAAFSFSIPISGVALPISGRVHLTLAIVLFNDPAGLSNNVEFGLEGLHITFA